MGDWLEEYTGKTTVNNQYPALTSSRNGLFFQTDYFDGHQIASQNNIGYNIVPRNYFTYRHMSDDEIFYFNINNLCDFGIVSTLYPVFTTKQGLDSKYLQYQLNNGNEFRKFAILQKQGGSRTYMYLSKLKKLKITTPKKCKEQEKISNLLINLDDLITLHQRKYDKLLNVKKALLDKMFPKNQEKTPKIRFKGFFDAWEQRKLGEIVEFYSGLTYKPNDIVDDDKETLVLRSCNVQNGEIIENDNVYVTSGVVNSKNVSQGDIIVVVRNGSRDLIGKHAVIKRNMLKTVIGAFMTGISSKYPNFVNSLLSTNQFFIEIEKNLGATINQITTGNFAKMNFTIPIKFDEKIKIGKMFLILDNLITLHQSKCEKLKNIKKALLDKMFV